MTAPVRIEVPTPPGPHPSATNCFAFLDGDAVDLVDPGWDDPVSLAALEAALAGLGSGIERVRTIVATHGHVDHLPLAARVRERSGARVLLGRGDEPDATIPLDGVLDDGDEVMLGDGPVRIVGAPGHTPGSLCIDLGEHGLLTGDTVLGAINPGIGLSAHVEGNPIRDYLATLARLAGEFAGRTGLPGHGPDVADLPARCRELAAHHRARTAQVAALLPGHPDARADDLAPLLTWTGGWDALRDVTRRSALRQTGWHLALAREQSAP